MPYLFALISIILLLPIILFINIGISKKGKLLIIAISLFIAVLGITAQMSYPLWQTALIILLFGFVSTYLLCKRYEMLLFQNNNEIKQNERIEKRNSYRNTIQILDDEEEESYFSDMRNSKVIEEVAVSLHDNIPPNELEEANELGLGVEDNNQALIDQLIKSVKDQEEKDFKANDFIEQINIEEEEPSSIMAFNDDEELDIITSIKSSDNLLNSMEARQEILVEDEALLDTIEELIKEGEQQTSSLDNLNEFRNEMNELPIRILPLEEEELLEVKESKEAFQIEDLEEELEELEELKPIIFSSTALERAETIEVLEFDEDEIVPIKEFKPLHGEVETFIKKVDPIVQEQPVKKENYLSEIEKLLEEE